MKHCHRHERPLLLSSLRQPENTVLSKRGHSNCPHHSNQKTVLDGVNEDSEQLHPTKIILWR